LRGLRVVPVTFQPVRYDPAAGVLKVARVIRVDVSFEGIDARNAKQTQPRATPASFDAMYRELVVNYEGPSAELGVAPGTWVVICPNDAAVTTRLQALVDWRQRQGYPVVVATTAQTGTTTTSIKSWIQNAYDTWSTPPEYVCLAGDATGTYSIPTWFETLSGYGGEGDHPYTQLEGNDVLSDVHFGRLSFSTLVELDAIIYKITNYEANPFLEDPGWYKRACLVGDPGASGYSTVQLQQWIKDRIRDLGYTEIDTIYADPFVSQMVTSLNQGDTIFSYRGFIGMSGWTNSNTYALTNGLKMPFAVTITCDTGSFAGGTSRSEGFLRANGGSNVPKGGIGSIGTATTGTHTRYNNCIHFGIFRGLLWEGATTLGASLTRGKLEMYLNYGATDPNQTLVWSYWNSLMGDPAVDCWTGFPDPLTVEYPASIALGANAVAVSVEEQGGIPCEGAQVCLLKSGQTFTVGFTDGQGEVELPISVSTTGDLLLTITKHDRHPTLATIPVQAQSVYVGYQTSTIDDDGTGESAGNANGALNPGETIELPVQLRNFGIQGATGVTGTLTSEDPFVTILDGQETYGNIAGGASVWSPDDFGFTLAPECPHGHVARLALSASANEGQWHSLVEIPVVSADLLVSGTNLYNAGGNGLFDPGETVQLSVKLGNAGGAAAQNVTGKITSLSNFVTVIDSLGIFGTINPGGVGENAIDRFSVTAALDTYQGYLAPFRLDVTYSGGLTETEFVSLPVGTRSSDDPIGPDRYGYFAFDNTDIAYADVPVYAWVEIDPNFGGQGTQVPLTDNGTYQDDSHVVDLPFPFQYYGQNFTKATICSNGWIAMGSTWLTDYRNWTIPGAGGPDGMISVFWDDLHQVTNGHVFQYHDAANHRWIVQWSRMPNEAGSTETVQAILYDPSFTPTTTGDGVIVLQYNQVGNTDSFDNYATVGIESPDGFDGLLYTFQNQYPAGAATLGAGRAIRFLPVSEVPSGSITGQVLNSSFGDAPIAGAEVKLLELGRTFSTASDGSYGGTVPEGTYTVAAHHPSFRPDTTYAVVVVEQQATAVDFHLTDVLAPVIVTQPHASTDDTAGPYPVPVEILEYSGLVERTLFYRLYGQVFTPLELAPQGGDDYLAQIPGQPYVTRVEYYVYARDSQGLERTDPPGAPQELYSFFVAPIVSLYADDLEANQGWTVGAPDDGATTGMWERVDPVGTFNGPTMVQPEDDHTPNPGSLCFVTDGRGGAQGDYDIDGGKTTLTSPLLDLTGYGTVTLQYHRWYTNDTGNAPGEDFWTAEVSSDGGTSWVTLETTNVSERIWKIMEFNLDEFVSVTETMRVRFIASDFNNGSIVEAGVDDVQVFLTGVTDAPGAGQALRFGLSAARPNPSHAGASIGFSLAKAGTANLAVYDVAGRLVRTLVDGTRTAGPQAILWDGRDDRGARVASGIYLVRLQGDGRSEVKKLVRIE
jgi:hypothetical protein